MRKTLVIGLVAGLVVGSLGGATAQAKKKKPKPKTVTYVAQNVEYFLRAADCTADVYSLSIENGEGDGTCGSFDNGLVNEVYAATGEPYSEQAWIAADGLPLKLDGTKAVTGTFYVTSWAGISAGPATLDVKIAATVAGQQVEVGTASVDYLVTPAAGTYEVPFEIKIPAELDKVDVEGLTLTTISRGHAPIQGYYEMEDPASSLTIPALVQA